MLPVTAGTVAAQINELRQIRNQAAIWRYGAVAIIAITVLWSVFTLRYATMSLIQPGPTQDQFTASLSSGLKGDVLPTIQTMAGQTLTEMKPQIMTAFQHIESRGPEVANASAEAMNKLQADVTSRSEQALDATFTQELKSREPKIRAMFPNATDAQMQAFSDNMAQMGEQHIVSANDRLLARHMNAMSGIVTDMTRIQDAEKVSAKSDAAPWQATIGMLDLVRDNLKSVAPPAATETVATASNTGKGIK